MNKGKALFLRYKELILYVFFGGMTTVVDFVVYWLFTRLIPIGTVPAQILSIAAGDKIGTRKISHIRGIPRDKRITRRLIATHGKGDQHLILSG